MDNFFPSDPLQKEDQNPHYFTNKELQELYSIIANLNDENLTCQ